MLRYRASNLKVGRACRGSAESGILGAIGAVRRARYVRILAANLGGNRHPERE